MWRLNSLEILDANLLCIIVFFFFQSYWFNFATLFFTEINILVSEGDGWATAFFTIVGLKNCDLRIIFIKLFVSLNITYLFLFYLSLILWLVIIFTSSALIAYLISVLVLNLILYTSNAFRTRLIFFCSYVSYKFFIL